MAAPFATTRTKRGAGWVVQASKHTSLTGHWCPARRQVAHIVRGVGRGSRTVAPI